MMNRIYGFNEAEEIILRQKKLIGYYILLVLCFVFAILVSCFAIKNNILLTVVFATLLLSFMLFSICFWKIKYGILEKYKSHLENLETGKREEFRGTFVKILDDTEMGEDFNVYVFASSTEEMEFLVHKQKKICFDVGKSYCITHIGKYLFEWGNIE